jgi:hypothetical protein
MWRLRDEAKDVRLRDISEQLQRNAEALRRAVPGLLRLTLAINETTAPDAADVLLYSEFESWNALRGYEAHALHVELRALLGPLRTERRVVDYET